MEQLYRLVLGAACEQIALRAIAGTEPCRTKDVPHQRARACHVHQRTAAHVESAFRERTHCRLVPAVVSAGSLWRLVHRQQVVAAAAEGGARRRTRVALALPDAPVHLPIPLQRLASSLLRCPIEVAHQSALADHRVVLRLAKVWRRREERQRSVEPPDGLARTARRESAPVSEAVRARHSDGSVRLQLRRARKRQGDHMNPCHTARAMHCCIRPRVRLQRLLRRGEHAHGDQRLRTAARSFFEAAPRPNTPPCCCS
eukprot:4638746-Prymnesium_polylepis.2